MASGGGPARGGDRDGERGKKIYAAFWNSVSELNSKRSESVASGNGECDLEKTKQSSKVTVECDLEKPKQSSRVTSCSRQRSYKNELDKRGKFRSFSELNTFNKSCTASSNQSNPVERDSNCPGKGHFHERGRYGKHINSKRNFNATDDKVCNPTNVHKPDTYNGNYVKRNTNGPPRDGQSQERGRCNKELLVTRKYPMAFRELENLIVKDSNEILLTLSSPKSGFDKLMQNLDNKSRDVIAYILIALGKACQSVLRFNVMEFTNKISSDKNFMFFHFQLYIAQFPNMKNKIIHFEALQHALNFLKFFQESQPASAADCLSILIPLFKLTLSKKIAGYESVYDKLSTELDVLTKESENFIEHHTEKERKETSVDEKLQLLSPPDNFRSVPVLPNTFDIIDHYPFLRPNLVQGRYMDVEHYLDVQFRLLREDYMRPLREGIAMYKKLKSENKPVKCKDVKVYPNVHVMGSEFAHCGLVHLVQFNVDEFRLVNWEYSKRFLTGSLLCFSKDDFETMHFATVARRKAEDLKVGKLVIKFEEQNDEIMHLTPLIEFVVLETQAYFEAYRHNLMALQKITGELPFENYIINVQKTINKPGFLNKNSVYDLRPLLLSLDSSVLNNDLSNLSLQNKFSGILPSLKSVSILNDDAWPKQEDINVDKSQYEALKAAITKEYVVVQGPPGTGKTYLGLRIVQLLLHNMQVWNCGEEYQLPILVVCYTNHALDQFLEGVLKFTKNIVRVGGRGKEELAPYQLINLRKEIRAKREIPGHIYSNIKKSRWDLDGLKSDINRIHNIINAAATQVLNEAFLKDYMDAMHYTALKEQSMFWNNPVLGNFYGGMNEWLQVSGNFQEIRNDYSEDELIVDIHETNDVEEDLIAGELELEDEEAGDIEFIEAMRDVDGEEFDDVAFTLPQRIERMKSGFVADKGELHNLPQRIEGMKSEFVADKGEWQTQGGAKQQKKYIKKMLKVDAMTSLEVAHIVDIWKLNIQSRWRLYKYWQNKFIQAKQVEIVAVNHTLREKIVLLEEMMFAEDVHVMRNAQIVGMTTTGAAKYRTLLQNLNPRIIVFEEAAEILESHIVTCLSPGTQQLILIGDHQQLRPSPIVYQLSSKYHFDVSLFERMVKNGIDCFKLDVQHRMRPSIASLLVPHIYSTLENHESVLHFDDIKGVSKNVYFLNHDHSEYNENESYTKVNHHEASFLISFCRYLILQGYSASQITILTTYTGQLYALKKLARSNIMLVGVRITVVDNFQGEENDIILISFVRSNIEGNIGFLKTANRVCVALSRAKKALYCMGNFGLLAEKSELWKNIMCTLENDNAVGNALLLRCQNHPETSIPVSSAEDFKLVPEGGCTKPCEYRLNCGHVCTYMCHPYDPQHEKFLCRKTCGKILCERNHPCQKICSQDCGLCTTMVLKIIPLCNHPVHIPCSTDPDPRMCTAKCTKYLKCGHLCVQNCNSPCTVACKQKVTIKSLCGHNVTLDCFRSIFPGEVMAACNYRCQVELDCGHVCNGTCGQCLQGRLHVLCRSECKRILFCGHQCKGPCGTSCPPCKEKCENRCVHSKCPKKCGFPCDPCKEKCPWKCEHKKCTKLCGELCDRSPCNVGCNKKLACGHKCVGFCGEPCPKKCRICDTQELQEIFFGTEEEEGAQFIQLEDCNHILEIEGITQWMQREPDRKGEIIMRSCPKCKTVIRKNLRFGNSVKSSLYDIEKVKNVVFGNIEENKRKKEDLQHGAEMASCHAFSLLLQPVCKWIATMGLWKQEIMRAENILMIISELRGTFSSCFKSVPMLTVESRSITVNLSHIFLQSESFEKDFNDAVSSTAHLIINFVYKEHKYASYQQLQEVAREVQRLKLMGKMFLFCRQPGFQIGITGDRLKTYHNAVTCITEQKPFTDERKHMFLESLKELKASFGSAVINVSEVEKQVILKAMNLSRGHWFQCPNGHVYCITECGGAMQEGKCNECGALIGGHSHALRSDNRVATAMDQAVHGAWTEAANMGNYDL